MKTHLFYRKGRLALLALVAFVFASTSALRAEINTDSFRQQPPLQQMKKDTIRLARRVEVPHLRMPMMTSPLPVEIRQQGRQLCIKSDYNQLLPIYTAGGLLYSSMRLNKGTNWLTGLPRGAYLINNRRYTIN